VLAIAGRVLPSWVTYLQAEHVASHKAELTVRH
jgi:hypothetical protein